MNQNNSREELIKELRMVANMINMGEKIQWARETTLMTKAADMLETHHQELQKAKVEAYMRGRIDEWHRHSDDFGNNSCPRPDQSKLDQPTDTQHALRGIIG